MLSNDIDTLCKYGNGIEGHLTNRNNHFCKSISFCLQKEIIDWDTPDNNENFKSAHSIQSNLIYKAYTMGLHFLTHQKHRDSHQLKPYLL